MAVIVPIVSEWNPKGVNRAMADIQKAEGKLGKTQAGLAKAFLPATAALAGLGAAAWSAAKSAEELVSSQAALNQVFAQMGNSDAADRVKDLADELERTLAVDEKLIMQVQTTLGTFAELAASADEAGGAFDRATLAALDLAAAGFGTAESNAIQLGKALQDPVKGLTALTRSGVTFTEQEKVKIKTLVESGKQLEAQEMILAAIEKQVGGTAEATADSSAKMSLGFADLKETIGLALLPAFDAMNDKLAGFAKWASENTQAILILGGVIGSLAAAVIVAKTALVVYTIASQAAAAANKLFASSAVTKAKSMGIVRGAAAGLAITAGLLAEQELGLTDKFYRNADAVDHNTTAMEKWLVAAGYTIKELFTGQGAVYNFTEEQRAMTSGTVAAAIAQGNLAKASGTLSGNLTGVAEATEEAATSAWKAAGSYLALWESIAGAARAERDYANTSGTVSSAIAAGVIAGPSVNILDKWQKKYGQLEEAADGAGRATGGVTEQQKKADKYAKAMHLKVVGDVLTGYEITASKLDDMTPKVRDKFTALLRTANEAISNTFQERRKALQEATRDYENAFSNIRDSIRGAFDIGSILGELSKDDGDWQAVWTEQVAKAKRMSDVVRELLAQGASEGLIQMIASQGAEGAKWGEAIIRDGMVPQMNTDLANVDVWAGEAAGAFADKFYGPGVLSAQTLLDSMGAYIDGQMDWLRRKGEKMGLAIAAGFNSTKPKDGTRGAFAGSYSVPSRSRSSSSVVNVNVTAGVGDPIRIAREVESIFRARDRRLGTP